MEDKKPSLTDLKLHDKVYVFFQETLSIVEYQVTGIDFDSSRYEKYHIKISKFCYTKLELKVNLDTRVYHVPKTEHGKDITVCLSLEKAEEFRKDKRDFYARQSVARIRNQIKEVKKFFNEEELKAIKEDIIKVFGDETKKR